MDRIRCLCLDVDGVLTDGRFYIDEEGHTTRAFHVQDGFAIHWFQKLGGVVAIITGKVSEAVAVRARELGIEHVIQDSRDKLADMRALAENLGLTLDQMAMVGDDWPDLPAMRACGFPIAVANAAEAVKAAARLVTYRSGGDGAVREAIEHLLTLSGDWQRVRQHYDAPAAGGPCA